MPSKNLWGNTLALIGCVALAGPLASGCVDEGEPSPAYREAQTDFNALYGKLVEDAYTLPEMAEIEKKLESVPKDSSDYTRAREQLKRIQAGRERVLSNRAEREAEIARALEPSRDFEFSNAKQDAPAGPVDAGVSVPVEGMKLAEFNARFGSCFVPGEQVLLNDKGMRPTWTLKDQPDCRKQFAGFEQKILVGQDDALYVIADRSKLEFRVKDK